jgi:hypothetical protein
MVDLANQKCFEAGLGVYEIYEIFYSAYKIVLFLNLYLCRSLHQVYLIYFYAWSEMAFYE